VACDASFDLATGTGVWGWTDCGGNTWTEAGEAKSSTLCELKAVVRALEAHATGSQLSLKIDYKPLAEVVMTLAAGCEVRAWPSVATDAETSSLWSSLKHLLQKHHVTAIWVPGHANDELHQVIDRATRAQLRRARSVAAY
jgi:ribonuclease HI